MNFKQGKSVREAFGIALAELGAQVRDAAVRGLDVADDLVQRLCLRRPGGSENQRERCDDFDHAPTLH